MPKTGLHIPLFPLNIFLLPGEQLPLHVFEPRYRQLFKEAEENVLDFGLPCSESEIGVELVSICRLVRVVKRYSTGESDVIIEAKYVATMDRFETVFPQKLYPGGFVNLVGFDHLLKEPTEELMSEFRTYIELKFGTKPSPVNLGHYRFLDLAASVAMSNEEKMRLVLTKSTDKRNKQLTQTLRYLNLLLKQERSIENGFILN
ncbi:MAG: LON peptidase substrate-binding domain-containing protein [Salibacteraceae bacterium]